MRRVPRYRVRSLRGHAVLVLALAAVLVFAGCGGSSAKHESGGPVWTPSSTTSGSPVPVPAPATTGWPMFGFDAARSGFNPFETTLTPGNVHGLHRLWSVELPGVADSSPALARGLHLPDGSTRDVLYVTTREGRLLALDATTGSTLWSQQPHGPKITHSSPALDASDQYVYAYGLDGYLHKYATTTGAEVRSGAWPAQITRMVQTEKESSSINVSGDAVYVTTSGYIGDAPPYQGHVVTVNAVTGKTNVFNSLCSNVPHLLTASDCSSEQSGIWARGGAVVDPVTRNVFATTGNGPFSGGASGHDWGDTVLELSPDGTRLLDSYTPDTYQELDASDADLGSTAPALLPPISQAKTPYLLVQGGKDATLRLLNRENLSGAGQPGQTGGEIQTLSSFGCGVFTQPAVWSDPSSHTVWVFVAATCALGGYTLTVTPDGTPQLHQAWSIQTSATSPILAGGVLVVATSGAVLALDPTNGHQLWSSAQPGAGGTIADIHWESPIVAGGRLYCSDESGHLTAYGQP